MVMVTWGGLVVTTAPTACPQHGDMNQVSRVSGLQRDTLSAELREQLRPAPPQAPVTGWGEEEARKRGQQVRTPTALKVPITVVVLGFLALGILALFAVATGRGSLAKVTGIGAGVCFALMIVLSVIVGFARASDNRRVRHGFPTAMAAWNEAYYCAHCDGVFFAPPAAGLGAPVGELLSLYQFRQVVWGVGGYADLA